MGNGVGVGAEVTGVEVVTGVGPGVGGATGLEVGERGESVGSDKGAGVGLGAETTGEDVIGSSAPSNPAKEVDWDAPSLSLLVIPTASPRIKHTTKRQTMAVSSLRLPE